MNLLNGRIVVGGKIGRARFLLSQVRENARWAEILSGQPDARKYEKAWRVRATELEEKLNEIERGDLEMKVAAGFMYRWLKKIREIDPQLLAQTMPYDCPGLGDLEKVFLPESQETPGPVQISA